VISPDRAANGAAELVVAQRRPLQIRSIRKEVVCIQFVIAKELKGRAMKLIRARFDRKADDSAGRTAILSAVIRTLDPELLNCIH
jgi:hypothetical protein